MWNHIYFKVPFTEIILRINFQKRKNPGFEIFFVIFRELFFFLQSTFFKFQNQSECLQFYSYYNINLNQINICVFSEFFRNFIRFWNEKQQDVNQSFFNGSSIDHHLDIIIFLNTFRQKEFQYVCNVEISIGFENHLWT